MMKKKNALKTLAKQREKLLKAITAACEELDNNITCVEKLQNDDDIISKAFKCGKMAKLGTAAYDAFYLLDEINI